MRHRRFLSSLPSRLLALACADTVGSHRATALTRRLDDAALHARAGGRIALGRLAVLGALAAGVLLGVAALGLAIAVELARKGA